MSSPARTSIYPRILPRDLLPAANALSVFAMNASMTVGPLLAGFLVEIERQLGPAGVLVFAVPVLLL